jgi:hypothetical protein
MDMRPFTDEAGAQWSAGAFEEDTPRHHGRWYLTLRQPAGDARLSLPEVRWQTAASARRTLQTMSEFELRRRLRMAQLRAELPVGQMP